MLEAGKSVLVLVDVQVKLSPVMHNKEQLFDGLDRLIRAVKALDIPVIWTEQAPDKMGPTIKELARHFSGLHPIPKTSFSCWGSSEFRDALAATGRNQVILAGIEAHVCIYQTAADLVSHDYHVEVVSDAVASRTEFSKLAGLGRVKQIGGAITTVEMLVFEILRTSRHPAFSEILKIVK